MPPARDDDSVGAGAFVIRALIRRWVTSKGGRERPTSDSLRDSNHENSCFVEGEITLAELRALYPWGRFARIPAQLLRAEGFWIERRPGEAPPGCTNPAAHVVCGPPVAPHRRVYEEMARRIVTSQDVELLADIVNEN